MNAHNLAKSAMNFNAEKYFEIGYKPPIKQRKKKKAKINNGTFQASTAINMILCIVPTWLWVLKGFSLHLTNFNRASVMTLLKRSLEKNHYKPWLDAKVILHEKEHSPGSQVRYRKAGRQSFFRKAILKACKKKTLSPIQIGWILSQKGSSD